MADYVIIGDSHTAALKQGFDANGLSSEVLTISGNLWHSGLVGGDDEVGISSPNPGAQAAIDAVRARLGGGALVAEGRPVIASIGFHLGRLAPPYAFRGHVAERAEFVADPEALFTSQGFLRAYVRQYRHGLVRLLRRMNRMSKVIVVAPPDVRAAPNYAAMRRCIVEMIRESNIAVYDPCETGRFAMLHPLTDDYLSEDRVHGNARYGAELVAEMLDRGVIPGRAEAA